MDISTILLIITILAIGVVIFLLLKKKPEPEKKDDGQLLMLQQQINQISQALSGGLSDLGKITQAQFNQNTNVLERVTEKITKIEETNKQVLTFTEQLQSFQNLLAGQKKRGAQGEIMLENILKNVLPPALYKIQYEFKNGEKVDAVIIIEKDKIIPIDSKFPLENYNRAAREKDPTVKEQLEKMFISDLKNRINEAAKYIRPNEGTLNYALMFIPADGIYTDLLDNAVGSIQSYTRDLLDYAHGKKVFIVSPNMFYAYLQTILYGFNMLQIEKKALEIKKWVEDLSRHLTSYNDHFNKMGSHLDLSIKSYLDARHEYKKIDTDIKRITEGNSKLDADDIAEINRPTLDED